MARGLWKRRIIEWVLIFFIILGVAGTLGYKLRQVQGQAEFATVQYTLGSLRTAMILEHLRLKLHTEEKPRLRNPFELLEVMPYNLEGERAMTDAHTVAPGSWFFDPFCECIAYRMQHAERLDEPAGSEILAFRIRFNPNEGLMWLEPLFPMAWMGMRIG